MLKELPSNITLKEYDNQKTLAAKADSVLRTVTELVEKEFGTEAEGVTFMPSLNVVCRLKDDPTSDVDPVSFSVVKRPNTPVQVNNIVHHILLKDPVFLSSIMHGLAENLSEMMSVHADMTSLVNSMGGGNEEESQVETDQNTGKGKESESSPNVQGFKKNTNEVN